VNGTGLLHQTRSAGKGVQQRVTWRLSKLYFTPSTHFKAQEILDQPWLKQIFSMPNPVVSHQLLMPVPAA
jgi:hypothetical protein